MWSSDDWLLDGSYCPESEIVALLQELVVSARADCLVHLAVDETALLRTLTYAVGTHDVSNLERSLRTPRGGRGRRSPLYRSVRRIAFREHPYADWDDEEMLQAAEPSAELLSAIRAEAPGTLESIASDTRILSLGYERAAIRSLLFAVGGSAQTVPVNEKRLASMINATPQAESRRDARWMEHSRVLPAFPEYGEEYHEDLTRFARSALKLATNITNATHASLYFNRATALGRLSLVASHGPALHFDEAIFAHLAPLPGPTDEDLADVLERQRSIQRRLRPTFAPATPEGVRFSGDAAEMMCPVPWTSASPDGPAAGVMVLHRLPTGRSFTARDLALARNVCLRVAIHRNASAAGHIGGTISTLRRNLATDTLPSPLGLDTTQLPSDVGFAARRVMETLPTLAEVTNSHSVSLRILAPSALATESHGHALQRVAAYPLTEMDRIESTLMFEDDGANWTVVRTGTTQVISDVTQAAHYTAVRNSRSELSVPVRSEGRLIGVLNLESPYLDHYAVLSPLVGAFAAAVGRTLVDSMADHSRRTLTRSLAIDNLTHDLEKYIVQAHDAVQNGWTESDLDGSLGALRDARRTLDRIKLLAQDSISMSMTVGAVLQRAHRQADLVSFDPLRHLTTAVRETECDGSQVNALIPAFRSIFGNLKDHGSAEPAAITGDLVSFSGSAHVAIRLASRGAFDLDPNIVRDLYRLPVRGKKKPGERLGAFLAGMGVRSIGGLISGSIAADDPRLLITHLLFPVAE